MRNLLILLLSPVLALALTGCGSSSHSPYSHGSAKDSFMPSPDPIITYEKKCEPERFNQQSADKPSKSLAERMQPTPSINMRWKI